MNSSLRRLWPETAIGAALGACPKEQLLELWVASPAWPRAVHRKLRSLPSTGCSGRGTSFPTGHTKKQCHLPLNTRHGEGQFWERPDMSQNVTFSLGFALGLGVQGRLSELHRSSSFLGRATLAALSGQSSPSCPSAPHTSHTPALWHSARAPLSGFTVFSSSSLTK